MKRSISVFAVGYALTAICAVGLAILALNNSNFERGNLLFNVLLVITTLLVVSLGLWVAFRASRRLRGRKFGEPAPKLQTRFIALFAVAAVVPAVLLASFQTLVLGRGIEFWFGGQVNAVVESAADLAREMPRVAMANASIQLLGVVEDVSRPEAIDALTTSPILYRQYLSEQARRRSFPALYVIDQQSTVLSRADFAADAPEFLAPSQVMYEIANEGDIGTTDPQLRDDAPDYVGMLYRLSEEQGLYLYAIWYIDFSVLIAQEEMTVAFREAGAREAQMRESFFIVYGLATVLIFIGAVWLALSAAQSVVSPVSRLVSAAERVRRGDLDARVDVPHSDDEIAALGRAFNRMTIQLGSQRKDLVEANEESERRRFFIEAVLTGVSAGVIGIDREGRITLANRSATDLLDQDLDGMIGKPVHETIAFLQPIVDEAARHPGTIAEHQIDILDADGAPLHLNVRAGQDEEGETVITFDDVTRLVAAQRNAAWRDVARRIAHEIKNPLTPIQLSAERLRRKYRDAIDAEGLSTFDKCIDTIVRQVSDIGRMVDEFSSFARMPTPKMEQVNLIDIVNAAVFAQRVASPNINLPLHAAIQDIAVECDSRLATQALANILKNAAESVSARVDQHGTKMDGEIGVSVYVTGSTGVIQIKDNGLGWPMPDKERLTEPYMTTREKGTGLGLAIVRRVMEDHGGRLELDERDDGETGAIVRLAFPLLETTQGAMDAPDRAEA